MKNNQLNSSDSDPQLNISNQIEKKVSTKRSPGRPFGSTISPGKTQKRINITIDEDYQKIAKRIGNGNLSQGIRLSLDNICK